MSATDIDPQETREWLEAFDAVAANDGSARAAELLEHVVAHARATTDDFNAAVRPTAYKNTIDPEDEPEYPGDLAVEQRLRAIIRWNAIATVLNANATSSELGGHIASYQSAATLYEVGFNHFWRGPTDDQPGDLVYMQGHLTPGFYARAFMEGRISEEQMNGFRQEVSRDGLSSYPHPWLMPDFWQFPTVSMGLGPIMSIYQARFMKYLEGRGLANTAGRKVWAFLGDGETDEPESLGAITLAARERLDNLIFVVNCNLQRLDGPVRGNGKIIQELETMFSGAGWNVLKVVWGRRWDPLIENDTTGALLRRMNDAVDGDYQTFKARNGAYVREHFFGKDPETAAMVEGMTDDEIWALNRGGHDPIKVHAAYASAVRHHGQPTVILAKTIKGYGMGEAGEGQNITHQQKKMADEALLAFRDRFGLPLTDDQVRSRAFYKPADDDPVMEYLRERRTALGGAIPHRRVEAGTKPPVPALDAFKSQLDGTGERTVSTTMGFVRVLSTLLRQKELKDRIVPIVPDESRTFGMEGMFRQQGIFSQAGQLYTPEDADQLMFYREDARGQILQEGINEAGAFSSWIASATSYANHGVQTIPFYIYYSMFGFQRVGDLAWAAGDSRARGFLLGGTAGRTTLNGEGLQHEDGHSHLLSSVIPNCVSYDPTYNYELAVIIQDGLRRMVAEDEDVFFYLTLMNENYAHPAMPEGVERDILRGMYRLRAAEGAPDGAPRVQLLGSGTILREVEAAAELLRDDHGVAADVWSVPSFTELAREGMAVERWNRLHPTAERRVAWVQECLGGDGLGPTVAATDYMRTFAEQIRPYVGGPYRVLGTDGFGRSDYRRVLRRFFEVDRHHVAVAALTSLCEQGAVEPEAVQQAIESYEIDPEVPAPWQT